MNIETIAEALKVGQVSPPELASYKDHLAGLSVSLMDKQLALQLMYARFYKDNRPVVKSDKAVLMSWRATPEGMDEMQLENTQRKIALLLRAISSHLRVASDQARNMY